MVGSVLMERMRAEDGFENIKHVFFATSPPYLHKFVAFCS